MPQIKYDNNETSADNILYTCKSETMHRGLNLSHWWSLSAVECSKQNAFITSLKHCYCRRMSQSHERWKIIIIIFFLFFYFILLMWLDESSSRLLWLYLRIHCRPCPHCQRLTGQTSADQGLYCGQTVSVTDDTSRQTSHCANIWLYAYMDSTYQIVAIVCKIHLELLVFPCASSPSSKLS